MTEGPVSRLGGCARATTVGLLVSLVMCLGALGGARPAAADETATSADAVRTAGAQRLAGSLRLVNYYPRDRAWEQQWTRFSPSVTAADFATARDLGATSIRVIVFPGVLGYPQPSTDEQSKLRTTIELADAAGLQVWLTLFDNFSSYADLAGSRTWTTALLAPYTDDRRIQAVEIRNEIKQTQAAMLWAQDQIALVHRLSPTTPVALSLNGSVEPESYATLLDAVRPELPDVVSYHYYGNPGLAHDHFRRVVAAVAPVPVVVGEAGLTTSAQDSRCADVACREAEQVDWYQLAVAAARQAGLSPPAPWTLFDLTSDATSRSITAAGFGYGLIRTDGTAKPAAAVVAAAFSDVWTTAPQDTDFAEVTMQGQRARAWVPWRPSGSFRVEGGAGVGGGSALAVTGTDSWPDGASAWFARPLTAVRPDQTWRVRVSVRGVGASGRTYLDVVWLDGDGTYLRHAVSGVLDVRTPAWQELSVVAAPPPGATAVRIHLASGGNAGTVYFSNPTWTVTG